MGWVLVKKNEKWYYGSGGAAMNEYGMVVGVVNGRKQVVLRAGEDEPTRLRDDGCDYRYPVWPKSLGTPRRPFVVRVVKFLFGLGPWG